MKSKIISVSNQKGGVGKTTTCINMGACLASLGKKVLIIDMDPQGNCTTGLGVSKFVEVVERGKKTKTPTMNIYNVLSGETDILNPGLIHSCSSVPGLDIIPSSLDLTAFEMEASENPNRDKMLSNAIAPLNGKYDYILLDCPPSVSLITINCLVACDCILIPIQCEFYALEGLTQLMNNVKIIKKLLNPKLSISHVLLTMYNGRYRLHQQIAEEIKKFFGDKLFNTKIPQNIKLAEAPSFGKPIIAYAPKSSGAIAYMHTTQELLARDCKRK